MTNHIRASSRKIKEMEPAPISSKMVTHILENGKMMRSQGGESMSMQWVIAMKVNIKMD